MNTEEVQKIIEQLKKVQSKVPEQDLEKIAQNLYELALFIVRLKTKKHLGSSLEDKPP